MEVKFKDFFLAVRHVVLTESCTVVRSFWSMSHVVTLRVVGFRRGVINNLGILEEG